METQEEEPPPSRAGLDQSDDEKSLGHSDDEKSMALSMHVIDCKPVIVDDVTPLKICNPNLRRSSRNTNNIYSSGFAGKEEGVIVNGLLENGRMGENGKNSSELGKGVPAESRKRRRLEVENLATLHKSENGSSLRRSPKLGSSTRSNSGKSKNKILAPVKPVSSEKKTQSRRRGGGGGNCSRKSPRLNPNLVTEFLELPATTGKRGSGGNCSRKLPRLNPNLGSEFLALPPAIGSGRRNDSGKGVTRGKKRRNRTVKMHVVTENENLNLIEFSNNKDSDNCLAPEIPSPDEGLSHYSSSQVETNFESPGTLERYHSEERKSAAPEKLSGEKCLRSGKIVYCLTGSGSVENKLSQIKAGNTENKGQSVNNSKSNKRKSKPRAASFFIGPPIPEEEAQDRWTWRYELKKRQPRNKGWILNPGEEDEIILNVAFHYAQANVDGSVYNIGDCAYIKGEGRKHHIGRILEFFKTEEGEDYFRVQWFFRAEDTVMKEEACFHNKKRIFYSTLMNDNPLDCIMSKLSIVEVPPAVGLESDTVPPADFYYDMEYCVEYSTFRNLRSFKSLTFNDSYPFQPAVPYHTPNTSPLEVFTGAGPLKGALTLLDLFAGCGGMSTGLCLGARLSNINLVTRWAVDIEKSACDSLKLNHPETQVRNASAEEYLELLKTWEKLCQCYVFNNLKEFHEGGTDDRRRGGSSRNSESDHKDPDEEYEVSSLIDICYGDPNETGKSGVHFKVRWKGYAPDDDTWEPIEGLSNSQECIQDFVQNGLRSKILPLPGEVDVICGGPPCQGISGYNRHRNMDEPLTDEKNQQIVVFMDIVEFLKPKYVLMENVVDILRLGGGSLGRYALSRLVHMKYQSRLGTVAAGCYGLPQFRLRVFIWGALPNEKLPPFPLPTHDVVIRYWPPLEFERNTVAYDEGQLREVEAALFLRDAISDLPPVTNDETCEVMEYESPPESGFQEYIRLSREEMLGSTANQNNTAKKKVLYDHRPYRMNEDNYLRVCQIPHKKGANFRDLPGVIVGEDNVVRRDTTGNHPVLPSGEPFVPDSSLNLSQGRSRRPFGRLWWDETVPTVITFPHWKTLAVLHPEQDRVLTIRECARLQGFPDFYRFCGSVKDRYSQVGNAVAIPVGRALGYTLGLAFQKLISDEHLMTLPPNFSFLRPQNNEIVALEN
ncbi:OLC1v1031059C2 [Oldenlandia corymbosa var. corymbosa]|uniref:DNA (cytosine-5-)-methyltransferase n=1 Tax=Oldenlandia corymbosa var. corymbosa TaxID=529605 RepID=A0AAV1CIG9_OLDCO|nr:OLC1v1031059C2 [Oldenlandia corymbosa var. corymbosa]